MMERSLDESTEERLGRRLDEARRARTPIALLTAEVPDLTIDDGYRVSRSQLATRLAEGERIGGWKVGLMSAATRAQVGIDQPLLGYVLASTIHADGVELPAGEFIAPGAEAEVAFVMGKDLAGPGVSAAAAIAAIEGAIAALEIVDCRYPDYKFTGPDAAADNNCGAGAVLGNRLVPLRKLDLPLEGLVWEHGDRRVATATAAEVNETPLASVVWLANKIAQWGMGLRAGDVVLAGSIAKFIRLGAGESARARFTRLGTVSARLG
jgi:2-keto-4-pentenoate hydratase